MTQPSIDSIAPISRRAIAYLIDALISGAIGAVGFVAVAIVAFLPRPTDELLVVMPIAYGVLLLVLLGWFVVYTVMQTRGGSIGMRAQRLRLASAVDGAPIGFGRALLRNVVFGLSAAIVVGYFTPLFDGSGRFQGWHDKVGNTVVVDAKKSPTPIRRADSAAATPAAASPAPTAPVTVPAVPLLPPAPLAGGYGAAPVPAPPGFPGAAGMPPSAKHGTGTPGYAVSQPESPFAAPAQRNPSFDPGARAFPGAPSVPGAPSFSGAPAAPAQPPAVPTQYPAPSTPAAAPAPLVPPVPSPGAPSVPAPGAASAFSVPNDGSAFAVPSLAPHTGSAPQHEPAPADPATATPGFPTAPAGAADSLIAFVPGVTPASVPAAPAAPVPPASAPAPVPGPAGAPFAPSAIAPNAAAPMSPSDEALGEDVFEETIIQPRGTRAQDDAELESTRISIPGHRLLFTWDDGTRVTVSRRTLFGRNPAHEDGAERVVVRDETLSLSKTHFEAAAEVSGGWVLDRHSTNGMTIVRDGERIDCPPGQRVPVRLGDAIEIGDRILTIGGYV